MIQDHQPEEFSIQPFVAAPRPNDLSICWRGERVALVSSQEIPRLPRIEELPPQSPEGLFRFAGGAVYQSAAPEHLPDGIALYPISVFREMAKKGSHDAYLLLTAYHLRRWQLTHRFCGVCGKLMQGDNYERALRCPDCGHIVYPVISPVICVAIRNRDKLLLLKNKRSTYQHFTLLSGYVEAGETLEQAVQREVMEEVGLRVRDIRYVGSQPWGMSQIVMIAFSAALDGTDKLTLQESEISDARWFRADELLPRIDRVGITSELIEQFRQGQLG